MLCPKCGYEMKPTDLDCPRCAKFAAEGTPIAAASPVAPPAGTSPANPIYVEDPYVHIVAEADVDSAVTTVYFLMWCVSIFFGVIVSLVAYVAVCNLEISIGVKSDTVQEVELVLLLPVIFFVSRGIHKFIKKKMEQYALSSGKRS